MTRFEALLRRLTDSQVELVVVGGLAVIAHGYPRATLDLDVCYARTPENIRIRILDLDDLIRAKAAAGRAKDLVDLEALRAIAAKRSASQ